MKIRKILVCPFNFKGSIHPDRAKYLAVHALREIDPTIQIKATYLADGGRGTLDLIKSSIDQCDQFTFREYDPTGREYSSRWIVDEFNNAYVESAELIGFDDSADMPENPEERSSWRLGATLSVVTKSVEHVTVFMGDTAVIDLGIGTLRALGHCVLDKNSRVIESTNCLEVMLSANSITQSSKVPYITLAVDDNVPLCGNAGLLDLFAQHKGIPEADKELWHKGIVNFGHVLSELSGQDITSILGLSGAGGVAAAIYACSENPRVVSAFDLVDRALGLKEMINWADLVVSGEGQIDASTVRNKGLFRLSTLCRERETPMLTITSGVEDDVESTLFGEVALLPKLRSGISDPKRIEFDFLETTKSGLAMFF